MTNTTSTRTAAIDDLDNFLFFTVEEASTPHPARTRCYVHYYWLTDAQGRIAFYNPRDGNGERQLPGYGSAQANRSESTHLMVRDTEWATDVVFLPVVFAPEVHSYQ